MDGRRRRKQQPEKKQQTTNPQSRIRELKKDIETFENQVNLMLEHNPTTSMDGTCVACGRVAGNDYHELSCQHWLCCVCHRHRIHNKLPDCPRCQPSPLYRGDSSSSSSLEDAKTI